jgi:hypothetical protein
MELNPFNHLADDETEVVLSPLRSIENPHPKQAYFTPLFESI